MFYTWQPPPHVHGHFYGILSEHKEGIALGVKRSLWTFVKSIKWRAFFLQSFRRIKPSFIDLFIFSTHILTDPPNVSSIRRGFALTWESLYPVVYMEDRILIDSELTKISLNLRPFEQKTILTVEIYKEVEVILNSRQVHSPEEWRDCTWRCSKAA